MAATGNVAGGSAPGEAAQAPAPTGPVPSILALTVIAALGTIGMHILIPVLPLAADEFGTTTAHMQLTITVYMVGLGVGQLFYGVLSDRFGRRPVLLVGLTVFFLGMVAAIPAQTPGQLLATRLVQALGACSGLVLGRAMVQDVARGRSSTSQLAILTMGMTATPMLAPLVGIAVAQVAGWRGVFAVLGAASLLLGIWCWRRLPETHTDRASSVRVLHLLSSFAHVARSRAFLGFVIGGSCITVGSFVFLGALPALAGDVLGESQARLAFAYLGVTACMTVGSIAARMLARRIDPLAGSRAGALLGAAGALVLLASAAAQTLSPVTLLGSMALFTFGAGLASPNALSGALLCSPGRIGSASALFGASQMGLGATLTSIPALLGNQRPLTMALLLLVTSIVGLAALYGLSRHSPTSGLPS